MKDADRGLFTALCAAIILILVLGFLCAAQARITADLRQDVSAWKSYYYDVEKEKSFWIHQSDVLNDRLSQALNDLERFKNQ